MTMLLIVYVVMIGTASFVLMMASMLLLVHLGRYFPHTAREEPDGPPLRIPPRGRVAVGLGFIGFTLAGCAYSWKVAVPGMVILGLLFYLSSRSLLDAFASAGDD